MKQDLESLLKKLCKSRNKSESLITKIDRLADKQEIRYGMDSPMTYKGKRYESNHSNDCSCAYNEEEGYDDPDKHYHVWILTKLKEWKDEDSKGLYADFICQCGGCEAGEEWKEIQ